MADRSIQDAAKLVLDLQNASNLSGVVHSLDEIVSDVIWPAARRQAKGTKYVNQHAIVTLFLHKLTSLNGCECFCSECINSYSRATAQVEKIAGGLTDGTSGNGGL